MQQASIYWPAMSGSTSQMRDRIQCTFGVFVFLIGIGALFALIADGYNLYALPGVFFIQAALSFIIAGVFFAWRHGVRVIEVMREEYLRRSFPNQPWLWRLDWSRRVSTIVKSSKNVTAWFATGWNLAVTPIAIAMVHDAPLSRIDFYFWGVTIAMGFALFLYATYRIWYRARLEFPPLRLHTNPGRPGRPVECTLAVPGFSDGIRWTSELVCLHTRSETVKVQTRYTVRKVVEKVWQQTFNPLVARSPRGAVLALRFVLGNDIPAMGEYNGGLCRWVVRVQGRSKGGVVRFAHEYDVPVIGNILVAAPTRVAAAAPAATATATADGGLQLQREPVDDQSGWRPAAVVSSEPAMQFAAKKLDVAAVLSELKATGIRFSKGGVIYPDELWSHEPLLSLHATINKLCVPTFCFAVMAAVAVVVTAPWYWALPPALLALTSAAGFGAAFYIRHHRYSVLFSKEGITRRSRLMSRSWQKTIPWDRIQSVVWKSLSASGRAGGINSYRQLIINPDDRNTRLVLSPALDNHLAAEALVKLLDSIAGKATAK